MKFYSGYNKPYIYVAYNSEIEEKAQEILAPLDDKGVLFWHDEKVSKKELNKIEMAFSVLVFVTKEYIKTEEFHKIINHAVKKNKEILTVFLEDVDLDAWGHMQLDSSQYLNVNQKDFQKKLLEASIFKNMEVTKAQKAFQKKSTTLAIGTPIIASILIFLLIINPLLIAPKEDVFGLKGLTQEELDSITSLYIMGDQVYKDEDIMKIHCYPIDNSKTNIEGEIAKENGDQAWNHISIGQVTRGTLNNLEDLTKLRNLKRLGICCQEVTDITPIFELTNLEFLAIDCNPITSIEGINKLTNLKQLFMSGIDVEDLSPLNGLKNLTVLSFTSTPITIYPNTEFLSNVDKLSAGGTNQIPSLGVRDKIEVLDFRNINNAISDFSFLKDVKEIDQIMFGDANINLMEPYLKNIKIKEINASNIDGLYSLSQLDFLNVTFRLDLCYTETLASLQGLDYFDGIEVLCIKNCYNIQDFYLLNNLKNTKYVVISSDMKDMVLSQLNDDVCFEILYEDG